MYEQNLKISNLNINLQCFFLVAMWKSEYKEHFGVYIIVISLTVVLPFSLKFWT